MRTEEYQKPVTNTRKEAGGAWSEKEGHYKRCDGSYFSAPTKGQGIDRNNLHTTRDEDKEEIPEFESKESDDYSLGINGGGYPSSQEGGACSKTINIGLVRCSKEPLALNLKSFLARDEVATSKKTLTITEIVDVPEEGKNKKQSGEHKILAQAKESQVMCNEERDNHINQKWKKADWNQGTSHLKIPDVEGRRTSARLQKDILLTTDDKTTRMGKKRNLEGTNLTSENSFNVLSDNEIVQMSSGMGVIIDDANFTVIDLMKDLEIARHCLADKKILPPEISHIDDTPLGEIEEELTDYESSHVQTPKRKGKPKNRLSLSGPRAKRKSKEISAPKTTKKGQQGNPDPPEVANKKKGKKKK